jgi:hypothetical protein
VSRRAAISVEKIKPFSHFCEAKECDVVLNNLSAKTPELCLVVRVSVFVCGGHGCAASYHQVVETTLVGDCPCNVNYGHA